MRRLVCACVVSKPPKTGFLASRPLLSFQPHFIPLFYSFEPSLILFFSITSKQNGKSTQFIPCFAPHRSHNLELSTMPLECLSIPHPLFFYKNTDPTAIYLETIKYLPTVSSITKFQSVDQHCTIFTIDWIHIHSQ